MWNLQPDGGLAGDGMEPCSTTRSRLTVGSGMGMGFINAVGIQSPGITSSPAIAKIVEGILKDLGLELGNDPNYNPHREPIIKYKDLEDFNKVKDLIDLELGNDDRLVCRCEQVSERTIRDAMNRGIPCNSFDSIKRRTRAGMGFCQGSFCRSRVIEVMEDELGKKVESAGSRLNRTGFRTTMETEKLNRVSTGGK